MDGLNLDALSPEETKTLLTQLIAERETKPADAPDKEVGGGQEGAMEPILKVLEILCSMVESLEEEVKMLRGVVMDDIIGGIDSLYKSNQRGIGVEGLRGKYGKLFDPHTDALKELSPDEDVFDKLYDLIESAKGGEGWDDTKEGDMATSLASGIAAKIAKIKGEAPAAEGESPAAEEAPPAVVEEVKTSAYPAGADEKLMKRIEEMKRKNTAKGL